MSIDFVPARDGFHFANRFKTRLLGGLLTTSGLCGGMVATVLDYWIARVPIPLHDATDIGAPCPPQGSRLYQEIYHRQVASLVGGASVLRWLLPARGGFDDVRAGLNPDQPSVVGLRAANGKPSDGHQVLCHGVDGDALLLYDPNCPDVQARLVRDGDQVRRLADGWNDSVYRSCFLPSSYKPALPTYRDLVVDGDTVRNDGDYPSRYAELGASTDGVLTPGASLDIDPGPVLVRTLQGFDVPLARPT